MSAHDLRIILYFAVEGDAAPEGPGWYLAATRPGSTSMGAPLATEEIIPRVRLNATEASKIGKVLDNFTRNKPLNYSPLMIRSDLSLEAAVAEANTAGAAAVQEKLAQAEDLARQLELLRARAGEFAQPPTNVVESNDG
jgi:hypothetical protein